MADAWDKVKAAETPVVAGALQPWLRSVTSLMGMLKPIIDKIAPVIHDLGVQFDALVKSDVARRFRDFVATFGALTVKAAGSTLIDFFKAFMIILPKFSPLIGKAVQGIGGLGPAVLKWAGSKKTADHITAFMAWFKTNGPVVGGTAQEPRRGADRPGAGPDRGRRGGDRHHLQVPRLGREATPGVRETAGRGGRGDADPEQARRVQRRGEDRRGGGLVGQEAADRHGGGPRGGGDAAGRRHDGGGGCRDAAGGEHDGRRRRRRRQGRRSR